jgi:hypothetical protein
VAHEWLNRTVDKGGRSGSGGNPTPARLLHHPTVSHTVFRITLRYCLSPYGIAYGSSLRRPARLVHAVMSSSLTQCVGRLQSCICVRQNSEGKMFLTGKIRFAPASVLPAEFEPTVHKGSSSGGNRIAAFRTILRYCIQGFLDHKKTPAPRIIRKRQPL